MKENEIREKIRQYIVRELMRDATYPLSDDEGICSGGLIDSFALAELGVYIEDAFAVYIPDPDLTVTKMDTLALIVARVLRAS
jgi:acyl carrier protein